MSQVGPICHAQPQAFLREQTVMALNGTVDVKSKVQEAVCQTQGRGVAFDIGDDALRCSHRAECWSDAHRRWHRVNEHLVRLAVEPQHKREGAKVPAPPEDDEGPCTSAE